MPKENPFIEEPIGEGEKESTSQEEEREEAGTKTKEVEKTLEKELEPFEIHEVTSCKVLASIPSATTIMENGEVGFVGFTTKEFSSTEEAEVDVNRWKNVGKEEAKIDREKNRLERVAKILKLVEKINESSELIPFPGILPEVYSRMKNDEAYSLGGFTPIDELIEKCKKEGIKVVLGNHPKSGNVYILPAGSTDIYMDSITPDQLLIDTVENEHLRELIQLKTKKSRT